LNEDPHRWLFEGPNHHKEGVSIHSVMHSNSPSVLIQAAAAGIGITRQPDFLVDDLIAQGLLVDLLADVDPTEHAFFAVVPSRTLMPARLRALLDFLFAAFQPARSSAPTSP
jgi:DNA-binding transcriptional LysR family regulator